VITIANRLGTWEEVYQQLGDASFYEYWRTNRALLAGHTPGYVVALELYDQEGKILQPSATGAMPEKRLSHTTIQIENGHPYIYSFSLVSRVGDAMSLIGHIGIKVDFHQALLDLNRFIYANIDTIRYPLEAKPMESVNELLAQTRFHAQPIAESEQLEKLMQDTIKHSATISLLLLLLAYILTSFLLHTPLRNLSSYIDALRRGNAESNVLPEGRSFCVREFEVLRNSVISYQLELEQMHSSLDQKNRELWKLAHHDALTGVPNRRAYEEDWQRLQALVRGQRIALSVLLLDCDHFKAINDSYGHDVGDRVLQVVATLIGQALREGDKLYRLGGDEFAIHLLNTEHGQAEQLATRCLQLLERHDFKQLGIR
jgi:diguanylate cyclase (GGDEF)-like protein